jgi:hypothetical protein
MTPGPGASGGYLPEIAGHNFSFSAKFRRCGVPEGLLRSEPGYYNIAKSNVYQKEMLKLSRM